MIVCVCHAVSDAHLRALAANGATGEELVRATRAGTSCGVCASEVQSFAAAPRPRCGKAVACPGCECLESAGEARQAA